MKTMFCSTVHKETQSSPLGLHLWSAPNGAILIVHIDDHGLFAKKLKPGMQIDSINGMSCTATFHSASQVQHYLHRAVGRVSIMATCPRPFASSQPSQQQQHKCQPQQDLTSQQEQQQEQQHISCQMTRRASSVSTATPPMVDIALDEDDSMSSSSSAYWDDDFKEEKMIQQNYRQDGRLSPVSSPFLQAFVKLML